MTQIKRSLPLLVKENETPNITWKQRSDVSEEEE